MHIISVSYVYFQLSTNIQCLMLMMIPQSWNKLNQNKSAVGALMFGANKSGKLEKKKRKTDVSAKWEAEVASTSKAAPPPHHPVCRQPLSPPHSLAARRAAPALGASQHRRIPRSFPAPGACRWRGRGSPPPAR